MTPEPGSEIDPGDRTGAIAILLGMLVLQSIAVSVLLTVTLIGYDKYIAGRKASHCREKISDREKRSS